MFVLGLTGSLGMGKSTTAAMFAGEGVPVHDADAGVHKLYEGEAVKAIEAAFPGTTVGGKVDRDKLGQSVLGDAAAMKKLEQIVHPLVHQAEQRFLADAGMHEASDLAGLDQLGDALFEPPAQHDFAIDLELELSIHMPILLHTDRVALILET